MIRISNSYLYVGCICFFEIAMNINKNIGDVGYTRIKVDVYILMFNIYVSFHVVLADRLFFEQISNKAL